MTKKIKGSKRLARRAAERQSRQPPFGGYKVKPVRSASANVASMRSIRPALSSTRKTRIENYVGILEKAAKVKPGVVPFYQHLQWTDRSGASQPLVEMPMMHLKSAIHLLRSKRMQSLKTAATARDKGARDLLSSQSALACAWLVVMEAEAERRDPDYAKLRTLQGQSKAQPMPTEIAAYPSIFIGA